MIFFFFTIFAGLMCELLWSDPQPQVQCMCSYIDLARAKSKALVSIYSLLKQNIKSCNAKGDVTKIVVANRPV